MSEPGVVVGRAEVVLALAGHVDHGKSALAGALTGSRTDRRQAEQARGLTVDLGHLVLHGPRPVAVTDVPGHVDYLGNTVVGLAGATHALLVVAADDGWMPQTEDHVRAATHLDVPIPVVAVSKTDLVDESRVDAVADDVRRRLAAVGDSPTVVPVSATAGYGLDELRDALAELSVSPAPDGAPRLWVDRAFRVEGRGLVVAGTLAAGALVVGDRVTVAPYGRTGRVRGLQCHGRSVDRATAPARVAVDLADVAADRGDRLVAGALGRQVPATTRVDAWVHSQHVPGIGDRGAWVLHVGSTHVEVEVAPLGRQPLVAGEDGPVALRLARPVPLVHGDRLVLRDAGRRVVAGGGVVLDPAPPPRPRGRRAREGRARSLATLRIAPDPAAALADADGGVVPATRIIVALADPTAGGNPVSGTSRPMPPVTGSPPPPGTCSTGRDRRGARSTRSWPAWRRRRTCRAPWSEPCSPTSTGSCVATPGWCWPPAERTSTPTANERWPDCTPRCAPPRSPPPRSTTSSPRHRCRAPISTGWCATGRSCAVAPTGSCPPPSTRGPPARTGGTGRRDHRGRGP